MRLEIYTCKTGRWDKDFDRSLDSPATLIVVFGSSKEELITEPLNLLFSAFPQSTLMGASSAGEIIQEELFEEALVVAVMQFHSTRIHQVTQAINDKHDSFEEGAAIARELLADDLRGVFVLADGLQVNGSRLTHGINSVLSGEVTVTGGLAADDDRFKKTWVLVEGQVKSGFITAVGLYGNAIHIGHGSRGGWDPLGIERRVTRSKNNILYELDNQPALEIYKRYLGQKAKELPASGLLFPLELKSDSNTQESKVRTILAVDEKEQSITFAGDIPEGSYVTLMKANYDRLIDGAAEAAESVFLGNYKGETLLSIAISCVGRRLVLKQRVEEELEATLEVLPLGVKQIGFYSYGEISPLTSGSCDFHNQTMTLSLLWEENAPTS